MLWTTFLCSNRVILSKYSDIRAGPRPEQAAGREKPSWLRQRAPQGERYEYLRDNLQELRLNTVCEEAQCPNVGECWNGSTGTATIMLLGEVHGSLQHSTVCARAAIKLV